MNNQDVGDLHRRIERELLDSYDEELELELDDQRFDEIGASADRSSGQRMSARIVAATLPSCCACRASS
jgi:hypothetical protein